MKEHRHPHDMIFIVCGGGREWGTEVRGGVVRQKEQYISNEEGMGGEQRQMKRERSRVEHLCLQ